VLHVNRRPQPFVNAVCKIGGGNDKDQLDDLLRVEVSSDSVEIVLLDRRRPGRQLFGEMDGGPFLLAENIPVRSAGLFERLDMFIAQTLSLRRSDVGARSILAPVQDRSAQVRELLDPRRKGAFCPDLTVEVEKGPQRVRPVGHDLEDIQHPPHLLFQGVINGTSGLGYFAFLKRFDLHFYSSANN